MSSPQHESHSTRQRAHLAPDPSGTGDIREEFLRDLRGQFRRVRGLLRAAVGYEPDAAEIAAADEPTEATVRDHAADAVRLEVAYRVDGRPLTDADHDPGARLVATASPPRLGRQGSSRY